MHFSATTEQLCNEIHGTFYTRTDYVVCAFVLQLNACKSFNASRADCRSFTATGILGQKSQFGMLYSNGSNNVISYYFQKPFQFSHAVGIIFQWMKPIINSTQSEQVWVNPYSSTSQCYIADENGTTFDPLDCAFGLRDKFFCTFGNI